jgi:hypothetical protein
MFENATFSKLLLFLLHLSSFLFGNPPNFKFRRSSYNYCKIIAIYHIHMRMWAFGCDLPWFTQAAISK